MSPPIRRYAHNGENLAANLTVMRTTAKFGRPQHG